MKIINNMTITLNLYLTNLMVRDITSLYIKALNDNEVVQFTEARHVKWNMRNVKQYLSDSFKSSSSQLIGIFLKQDDKHIGNIRLSSFSLIHKRVDLGIMIFDKTQWGKGYGTESINGIIRYVFTQLNIHKICADYYVVNIASAKIFKKAGFIREGVFHDHFFTKGKFVDSIRVVKYNMQEEGK